MSKELIELLRQSAKFALYPPDKKLYMEAADAIERLEAENALLKQVEANLCELHNVALSDIRRYREIYNAAFEENAALRKDAERYRMMRKMLSTLQLDYCYLEGRPEEVIDADIDAAMSSNP